MSELRGITTLALLRSFAAGCVSDGVDADVQVDTPVTMEVMQPVLASITAEDILRRTSALAADSMEGRLPGTVGEERAVRYIEEQFRSLGLASGNPDGTYQQEVPLVGITPKVTAWLTIGGRNIPLQGGRDCIAESTRVTSEIEVEGSELVFVGYGVVAPEYGWDDYQDVDVSGKTVVMLVNDPPIRLAGDTVLDQNMFRGEAMTYYGRWTYKYEIAAEKGAAVAIVVHETGPAAIRSMCCRAASSARASTSSPQTTTWVGLRCRLGCPSRRPAASSVRWATISTS